MQYPGEHLWRRAFATEVFEGAFEAFRWVDGYGSSFRGRLGDFHPPLGSEDCRHYVSVYMCIGSCIQDGTSFSPSCMSQEERVVKGKFDLVTCRW